MKNELPFLLGQGGASSFRHTYGDNFEICYPAYEKKEPAADV